MKSMVTGADAFLRDLQKLGAEMPRVKRAMLKAGGEAMAESWRQEIDRRGFVLSGAMKNQVRYKLKTGKGNSLRAEISSYGDDGRGVSNGTKAFYLHYGTSRGIPASHWIDAAEQDADLKVQAAMRAVLDDAIRKTVGGK